jgi:ABC-type nitrate/sulfonate/bicarbonate transport system permease component
MEQVLFIQSIKQLPKVLFGINQPISRIGYRVLSASLLIAFLLSWQFLFPSIIPKLDKIWEEFVHLLLNEGLLYELGVSLVLAFKAMFFSVIVAFSISYLGEITNFFKPIAVAFERFRFWSLFGFAPVIRILTADGDALRLGLVMFAVVPFMVTSFNKVLLNVREDKLYDYAYSMGMSQLRAVFEVVFRSKLKVVIIAIASNFAIAWLTIPAAEVASRDAGGIGAMLFDKARFVPGANGYAAAFAVQCVILTCGIMLDSLFHRMVKALPEERAKSEK